MKYVALILTFVFMIVFDLWAGERLIPPRTRECGATGPPPEAMAEIRRREKAGRVIRMSDHNRKRVDACKTIPLAESPAAQR